MYVGLRFVRQIKVHNESDILDIYTPRSDVGRHQNRKSTIAEPFQGTVSLSLRAVSVDRLSLNASLIQETSQLVGPILSPSKDY